MLRPIAWVAVASCALTFLQLGCGDDASKSTDPLPPVPSVGEFGVADSSGMLVVVRSGTASGAIRMIVGEEVLLHIRANVDGSPLPAGSKVVNVRIPAPDEVAFTLFPNSLSFVLYALRPASTEFVVTMDIPGIGLQESPPLRFFAVPPTSIAGVLVTSQFGARYQQLGTEESGRLLVDVQQASVIEVAALDEAGKPIADMGRYTGVKFTLLDPVYGVSVEPIPGQFEGFVVSATLRVDPVWVVARVERGGVEIYTSNPIRLWIQGPPDQAGHWYGFGEGQAPDGTIADLISWDGLLVASGNFEHMGELVAHGVAAWDGFEWSPLGSGVTGVEGLVNASGELLAITSRGIQRWDRQEWVAFDPSRSEDPAFFWHEDGLYVQDNTGVWRRQLEESWGRVPWRTLAAQAGPTGSTVFAVRPHYDGPAGGASIDYWSGEEWIRTLYWHNSFESTTTAQLLSVSGRLFLVRSGEYDGGVEEWTGSSWMHRLQGSLFQHYERLEPWRNALLAGTASQVVLLDGYEMTIGEVRTTHYSGIAAMTTHDGRLFIAGKFDRVDDTAAPGMAYYVLE